MSLKHQIVTQPTRLKPIVIDHETFLELVDKDEATGKMRYKLIDSIRIGDEIIETRCITGFSDVRDYAEENKFVLPPKVKINRDNLKLLRDMKQTMADLKASGEKFDPNKHMPQAWVDAAGRAGMDLDSRLSFADQDAINDGRARMDDHGYVLYDYSRQLLHDRIEQRKARGERFTANMIQIIAEQGA